VTAIFTNKFPAELFWLNFLTIVLISKKKKTLHFLTTANLFAAKMVGSLRTTAIKT
jgi:hypothetical protein